MTRTQIINTGTTITWPDIKENLTINEVEESIRTIDTLVKNLLTTQQQAISQDDIVPLKNSICNLKTWVNKNTAQITDITKFINSLKPIYTNIVAVNKIIYTDSDWKIVDIVQTIIKESAEEKLNHDSSLTNIKKLITEVQEEDKILKQEALEEKKEQRIAKIKMIVGVVLLALTVAALIVGLVCTSVFATPILPIAAVLAIKISAIALSGIASYFILKELIVTEHPLVGFLGGLSGWAGSMAACGKQNQIGSQIKALLTIQPE